MAEFYEMPSISPTMEVGTLVQWKVSEGEAFESGTILAEIGTDKANMDAEIFDDGVLLKRLVDEGAEIPPGYPIAIWGAAADEDIGSLLAEFEVRKTALSAAPSTESAPEPVTAAAPAAPPAPASLPTSASLPASAQIGSIERKWMGKPLTRNFMDVPGDIHAATTDDRPRSSPLARKVAADRGVDLRRVSGTGPGGRIIRADVDNAPLNTGAGPSARTDESVRNSPMRKTIAKRLLQSHQDIPVFFLTATFDMRGFVDLRAQLKRQLPDVRVSYNDILIKAVARSLAEHPYVNAQWTPDAIIQRGTVDVGVAVALPAGLITPVVRNADQKGLVAIGSEVRELAGRARDGKLGVDEYTGATFTISNLGMMQIDHFTAIINPPESAILAVGSINEVPVVIDGTLSTGWRMKVTMSCDHRVIDGAVGASFLQTLRRYVESPVLLLA